MTPDIRLVKIMILISYINNFHKMELLPKEILDYIFKLTNILKWKNRLGRLYICCEEANGCENEKCKSYKRPINRNYCDNCLRLDNPFLYFIFRYRLNKKKYFRIRMRYINGQFIEYGPQYIS
jgi:hypothetical protein